MDTKNTGGPAFPVTPTDRSGQLAETQLGMTVRDWFATHAPAEVPDWFNPEPVVKLPPAFSIIDAARTLAPFAALPKDDAQRLVEWLRDDCPFDIEPALMSIADSAGLLVEENVRQRLLAKADNEMARLVAWRWWYADMMLKARGA